MKRMYCIGALALILAACGTTAAPTTPPSPSALPSTPAEAAVPATDLPATALPAATAAPASDLPATALPAATAAPASDVLDTAVVPIVDPRNGFLLGGVRNGAWLSYAATAPLLSGAETYRLYTDSALAAEVGGSAPELVGAPCEEIQQITLSGGSQDDMVAVAGPWDALPRLSEDLPTDSPVYREAVAELLDQAGVASPNVQITRILRVDLEGDGVDEVLLAATYMASGDRLPSTEAGDYSLVALRTLVGEAVQTTIIDQDIYLTAAEFAAPTEFALRGVADLNGDGTLEVLVDYAYYEGNGLTVYAVEGSAVTAVLGAGCGA